MNFLSETSLIRCGSSGRPVAESSLVTTLAKTRASSCFLGSHQALWIYDQTVADCQEKSQSYRNLPYFQHLGSDEVFEASELVAAPFISKTVLPLWALASMELLSNLMYCSFCIGVIGGSGSSASSKPPPDAVEDAEGQPALQSPCRAPDGLYTDRFEVFLYTRLDSEAWSVATNLEFARLVGSLWIYLHSVEKCLERKRRPHLWICDGTGDTDRIAPTCSIWMTWPWKVGTRRLPAALTILCNPATELALQCDILARFAQHRAAVQIKTIVIGLSRRDAGRPL